MQKASKTNKGRLLLFILIACIVLVAAIVPIAVFSTQHYQFLIVAPAYDQLQTMFATYSGYDILSITYTGAGILPTVDGNGTALVGIDTVTRGAHPDRVISFLQAMNLQWIAIK